jgi:hypothetical protein
MLGLFFLASSVLGAEVSGLYEAEVQVFSQKRAERATAMSAALSEVLAKVSGRRDAAMRPGVAEAVRQPAAFLQQYLYRALPESEKPPAVPGEEPQLVFFRFDKEAIDKVLRDNGLPVWGATRPAALVWLAVEDAERRFLVSSDMPEPVRRALEREARQRGLAVVLPLLDLEDRAKLQFAEVWGGFHEPVLAASARYRTEAVLTGRMQRTPAGEWTGTWTLLQGDASRSWEARGVLAEEVVDAGMAGVVDALAARYAPSAAGQQAGVLPMVVTAVRGLRDYARVVQYLQSLQQVSRVQPMSVDGEQVGFELELRGDAAGLVQTIGLGNVLAPAAAAPFGAAADGTPQPFVYRLVP